MRFKLLNRSARTTHKKRPKRIHNTSKKRRINEPVENKSLEVPIKPKPSEDDKLKSLISAVITIHGTVASMYDQMIKTMAFQDALIKHLEMKGLMKGNDRILFMSIKNNILQSNVYKEIADNLERFSEIMSEFEDDDILKDILEEEETDNE